MNKKTNFMEVINNRFEADIKKNLQKSGREFYNYIIVGNGLKIQVDRLVNEMADNKELPEFYMIEYNNNPIMLDVLADVYRNFLIMKMNEMEGEIEIIN